jgi:hypothetical protein
VIYLVTHPTEPEYWHEVGKDLEYYRLQVWQVRDHLASNRKQWVRNRSGMRIEPKTLQLKPASQMDLPNAVERETFQEPVDALATIALISIDVVKIKQDTTIGAVDEFGQKVPIGEFVARGCK